MRFKVHKYISLILKFTRFPENVLKVENFLKQNNFTILSEEEASDLAKATKLQMAIFGWRVYVTKRSLG